jgi:hypothetical protein
MVGGNHHGGEPDVEFFAANGVAGIRQEARGQLADARSFPACPSGLDQLELFQKEFQDLTMQRTLNEEERRFKP